MTLPANFAIPSTIIGIGPSAFKGATFQGAFSLPNKEITILSSASLGTGETIDQLIARNAFLIFIDAFENAKFHPGFTLPQKAIGQYSKDEINSLFQGATIDGAPFSI